MSASTLSRLSHEALVAHIRGRVDVSSDSFYQRESSVAPVQIKAYPKRRRLTSAPLAGRIAAAVSEPTYADFLREPARQLATA